MQWAKSLRVLASVEKTINVLGSYGVLHFSSPMLDSFSIDSNSGVLWMQITDPDAASKSQITTLALQAKTGDPAAFDRLMELEQGRVLRIANRLLVQSDDTADAIQEVFLRLYKHIETFDPSQHWDAWIYRIAVNVCRDMNRKRRWRELLSLDAWLKTGGRPPTTLLRADDGAVRSERRKLLEEGLRRLPEKERAALVLRDVEGLSAAEAAQVLGTREATVRSQASRARSRLREFLTKRTGGSLL